jgi:hypothetical protein
LARVLIHIPEPNKHLVRPARTSLLAEPRIDGGSVLTSRSSFAATALLPVWVALALDPPFLFPRYFLVSIVFVALLVASFPPAPLARRSSHRLARRERLQFAREGRGCYEKALRFLLV